MSRFRAKENVWLQSGIARDCFLEGPSYDRDGNLYVTNIPHCQIFRVSPEGEFTLVATYDGEPNCVKIHKDGRIFIADHKQGLLVLDPNSENLTPLVDRPRHERFKGLNDLVFTKTGDLYFTDQGESGLHDPTGRLWRLRRDGRLELVPSNAPSPNGLVLTPNEDILYLAMPRGNAVWRVPLLPDGNIGRVGIFLQLSGGMGPDGMAIDAEGNSPSACRNGVDLGVQPPRPAGRRDPILHRHWDDQCRLWRAGAQEALHHRKRDRHDPVGRARGAGEGNLFAYVRRRFANSRRLPPLTLALRGPLPRPACGQRAGVRGSRRRV